jgi:hypothetical protein
LFTLVGGLFGAVAYSYVQPAPSPRHSLGKTGPKLIFSNMLGAPYWAGALVLAAVIVVILVGLEAWSPWRGEMGKDVDGDLPASPPDSKSKHAPPACGITGAHNDH